MRPTDRPLLRPVLAVLLGVVAVWLLARLSVAEPSRQVIVGSRVATMESVIAWCGGDTVRARAVAQPLPIRGSYLSAPRLRAELLYNRLALRWLPAAAALAALLLIPFRPPRTICLLLSALLAADFALRWILSGSIPLAGRAESAAAGALILTAVLTLYSQRRVVAPGLGVVLLLALVAAFQWSHPAVRPIPDDLRSAWLPVHVTLIISAYALFALGAVVSAVVPDRSRVAFRILAAATLLLAAGIAAGSAWAAGAWGRWWSWDPKETAALITLILYITLLCAWRCLTPSVRRWLPAVALMAVAVTWWGISSLGGLHSY